METFDRFVHSLSKYCDHMAKAGVVAMMLIVAANIILRVVWHPINGTYDYVSFIGAVLVAFALAYTAIQKGHIEIEMLMERFPKRVQEVTASIMSILSLGFFVLVTWQSVLFANDMWRTGDTTMTALLPYYPYIYAIAFGSALLSLVILNNLIKSLVKAVRG